MAEKNTYYFQHDYNARNDPDIISLRAEYGWEGYGIYWLLVEMMYESADSCIYNKAIAGLSKCYNIDITLLSKCIETAIEVGLFGSDGNKFWSDRVLENKQYIDGLRTKRSEAGKQGMASRWGSKSEAKNEEVITPLYNKITNDNKGKEKKGKESKGNEIKRKDIYTDDFLNFWNEYPRKDGKIPAFKAFDKRIKEAFSVDAIILGTKNYAVYCQRQGIETRFIKLPATFLNDDLCFTEWAEKDMTKHASSNGSGRRLSADEQRQANTMAVLDSFINGEVEEESDPFAMGGILE